MFVRIWEREREREREVCWWGYTWFSMLVCPSVCVYVCLSPVCRDDKQIVWNYRMDFSENLHTHNLKTRTWNFLFDWIIFLQFICSFSLLFFFKTKIKIWRTLKNFDSNIETGLFFHYNYACPSLTETI